MPYVHKRVFILKMRGRMRKVYIILTGIFLSLLFITCKQFNADIDSYLSY